MNIGPLLGIKQEDLYSPEGGWSDPISGVLDIVLVEAQYLDGCSENDTIYAEICTGDTGNGTFGDSLLEGG